MPAAARRAGPDASIVPLHKPKFVVAEGRGNSGKTTAIRLLMERALNAGRDVQLIDLDPRAQLGQFFGGVQSPPDQAEVVIFEFLDALVNAQAETVSAAEGGAALTLLGRWGLPCTMAPRRRRPGWA